MRLTSWAGASYPSNSNVHIVHCDGPRRQVAVHSFVRSRLIASLEASMSVLHFSIRIFAKQNHLHLVAALIAVLTASSVLAQIVETGNITGTVRDNTGAVIQNAHVTFHN